MSKSFKNDLTGQRFGRLTVLEFVPREETKKSFWKCRCDCGNMKTICAEDFKNQRTVSCGCKKREKRKNEYVSRLRNTWQHMKQRCLNTNATDYKHYGGRGISICDAWKNSFQSFYDWAITNGYKENLSIDRIDVNGNYEPSNCRWVTQKTQVRNRRNSIKVEYNGKIVYFSEAAELSKIPYKILEHRYRRGDRGERLFRPVEKKT